MSSRTPLEEIQYQKLHYHDDKAPAIYAGSTILIASATVFVITRLVARRMSTASWQADDYSIVVALVGYSLLYRLPLWLTSVVGVGVWPVCVNDYEYVHFYLTNLEERQRGLTQAISDPVRYGKAHSKSWHAQSPPVLQGTSILYYNIRVPPA